MPGFANSGVYRVTSFKYVQMIPSPRVGSGVDVRHTESPGQYEGYICILERRTLNVVERKDPESVVLSATPLMR